MSETTTQDAARLGAGGGAVEREVRELAWLRHGCPFPALYGDDGEMSCGNCLVDFKRAPLVDLLRTLAASVTVRPHYVHVEGTPPNPPATLTTTARPGDAPVYSDAHPAPAPPGEMLETERAELDRLCRAVLCTMPGSAPEQRDEAGRVCGDLLAFVLHMIAQRAFAAPPAPAPAGEDDGLLDARAEAALVESLREVADLLCTNRGVPRDRNRRAADLYNAANVIQAYSERLRAAPAPTGAPRG